MSSYSKFFENSYFSEVLMSRYYFQFFIHKNAELFVQLNHIHCGSGQTVIIVDTHT